MSGQLLSVILFPVLGLLRRTRLTAECGSPLGHQSSEVCLDSEEQSRAEQGADYQEQSRSEVGAAGRKIGATWVVSSALPLVAWVALGGVQAPGAGEATSDLRPMLCTLCGGLQCRVVLQEIWGQIFISRGGNYPLGNAVADYK